MSAFEPPPIGDLTVLWEHPEALVVDKPWGVLVHNSAFAGRPERSLKQALEAQRGELLQPVHRLDRGTSGVTLFVRDPSPERVTAWSTCLAAPSTQKRYVALVRGRPAFDTRVVDRPIKGDDGRVLDARSTVQVLAHSEVERCSLVAVDIDTGRRHQIRRHLAHLRHPVIGDSRHGDAKFNRAFRASTGLERLALHAVALRLTPPGAPSPTDVFAPPSGPFADAMEALCPGAFGMTFGTMEVPP